MRIAFAPLSAGFANKPKDCPPSNPSSPHAAASPPAKYPALPLLSFSQNPNPAAGPSFPAVRAASVYVFVDVTGSPMSAGTVSVCAAGLCHTHPGALCEWPENTFSGS